VFVQQESIQQQLIQIEVEAISTTKKTPAFYARRWRILSGN